VAIWFLLLDMIHGRLFFTPAALGSAIFRGASGVDEVQRTAGMVLGYTLVHVVAFLIVGLIAARLMFSADAEPRVLLGAGVAFVTMEVGTLCVLALVANWLLDALSFWTVLVANIVAAVVIGYYLYQQHPHIRRHLQENLEERDVEAV
jgi:O-antigen/teichoic acid export membrane protein